MLRVCTMQISTHFRKKGVVRILFSSYFLHHRKLRKKEIARKFISASFLLFLCGRATVFEDWKVLFFQESGKLDNFLTRLKSGEEKVVFAQSCLWLVPSSLRLLLERVPYCLLFYETNPATNQRLAVKSRMFFEINRLSHESRMSHSSTALCRNTV